MTDAPSPNTLAGEDWAGEMGQKWLTHLDRFEGMIAPIGEALLARADYQPDENVLDLGCGGGATSIAIGRSVAPDGKVLGLDISPDLIAAAATRAGLAGADNVRFMCADAATAQPEGAPFDRLHSRFGSMFFPEPVPAFANLRGQLKPGARIDLAVWASPRDNLWMMEVMGVVRQIIDIPPTEPRAPGPFAFEDLDYLRSILADSGYSAPDIAVYEGLQPLGGAGATPEEAVNFILSAMAVGRALAEHGEAAHSKARTAILELFDRHYVPGEGVMMAGKVWLVTARA
jgi:SAM-dependent methyltransferase